MLAHGQTVISYMEQFAPKHYALPNDAIGLQLGTLDKKVSKVLIALDVTEEVIREAIAANAGIIIAHHAIIYKPVKHLRTDLPAGKLYELLIKHDIAVYIAHTNLDVANGGVNDILAEGIGLEQTTPLHNIHTERLHKLDVYVPEDHHEQRSLGIGRVGVLPAPVELAELTNKVKKAYDVSVLRVIGNLNKPVRKVAVLGGAGRDYVKDAIFAGADVLITGDIDYHTAHDALAAGICLIDAGHNIEKLMKPAVAAILNEKLKQHGYTTEAVPSEVNTEPFIFM